MEKMNWSFCLKISDKCSMAEIVGRCSENDGRCPMSAAADESQIDTRYCRYGVHVIARQAKALSLIKLFRLPKQTKREHS